MRKVLYVLGQLSDADVEWLTVNGRKQRAPAETTLIRQGHPVDSLYIVLDGRLAVMDTGLGGKVLAHLGCGEIVGEMSFVDGSPPAATVKALEDSIVLALPRRELEERLATDLGFAARFYRALAVFLSDRLRSTVRRLGYGEAADLDESVKSDDELDLAVLDNVHLAGSRFDRMLKQLLNG